MEGASGGSIFVTILLFIIHVARYYWFEQKAF